MKTYQNRKENGDRTSPAFERETEFFIPVGIVLLEIEECSDNRSEFASKSKEMRN